MATRCDVCGKGVTFGRNIRHQHGGGWARKAPRTNRTFAANVRKRVVHVDGKAKRIKICTRCLRSQLKTAV